MKKVIQIISCFLFAGASFAQVNLVPNPSFEDTLGCPQGYPDLDTKCKYWESFRITPDYINNCSAVCGYFNQYGYQLPHSGQAYAGFNMYQTTVPNSSEHIAVQLNSPLIIGTKYFVSFYVSLAYNFSLTNIACNKIGALVTTYQYSDPNGILILPDTSTLHTDLIVTDTLTWTRIFGSFTADSSYTYLILGNFFSDGFLDTINLPYQVASQIAYYYLDDVCLSTDSLFAQEYTWTGIEENKNEVLLIYPNPADNYLIIKSEEVLLGEVYVLNVLGEVVFNCQNNNAEIKIDCSRWPSGIYFLKNKNSSVKIIVHH